MPETSEQFSERFCTGHIEEIAHLDRVRERALLLSDFTLDDFVRMDRRLLGHLRGLTLRNKVAWKCIKRYVDTQGVTSGVLFAAGILALATDDQQRLQEFRTWIENWASRYPLSEQIARWIVPSWHRISGSTLNSSTFIGSDRHFDSVRRLVAAATPQEADAIVATIPRQSEPETLVGIAHAVRKFGLQRFAADIVPLLEHKHTGVKVAAWMALLRLEGTRALDLLWRSRWEDLDCPKLFYRAMSVLPLSEVPAWIERLESHGRSRDALVCIAFSGSPEMLPHLRSRIGDRRLSTLAKLCHVAVTGYKPDEAFDAHPTGSRDGQAEFPPLDQPEAFFFSEQNHRQERDEPRVDEACWEGRVIAGQTITVQHAISVLRSGLQLQRVIASYWLENQGAGVDVDTTAPGFRQAQELSGIRQLQ